MQFSQNSSSLQSFSPNVEDQNTRITFFNKNFIGEGGIYSQTQQKTEEIDITCSGMWRTNQLLEESPLNRMGKGFRLRHVTSFEQKSMEVHGKKLKEKFIAFVQSINMKWEEKAACFCSQDSKIEDWEDIEDLIYLLTDLQENIRSSLVGFAKRNVEAQMILKQLFHLIPQEFLIETLIISEQLFRHYEKSNIIAMDQEQIEVFVGVQAKTVTNIIKEKIPKFQANSSDQGQVYLFNLIESWMELIFYALNGIFEESLSRRPEFDSWFDLDSLATEHKLIKID